MKKVLILMLVIGASMAYAQEADGIYVKSEFLPSSDVSSVTKLEAGLNYPIINTEKNKLSIGGKVQSVNFDFIDEDVPFETGEIDNFKSFSLKLNYQHSLSDSWAFNLMGESQVSSNFSENEIKSEDLFFNGLITFEKYSEANNSIWTFGAVYDIKYGLNYPIPVISYTKRIDENWAYKIGVPDSRVKWSFAEKHEVEGFATLSGFTGNLNDVLEVYKDDYTGMLTQTSAILGLGYKLELWKNFDVALDGGFTVYNSLQFTDYNNDEVYDFDIPNSFYINVGLKYSFESKLKTKKLY